MTVTLIQIDAWDPEEGEAVTLRAASHDDPAACHLDGHVWWPSIAELPKLRYDFFSGSFDGQIDTPSSSVTLMTEAFPTLPRLALADARFRLWTGELGDDFADYVLRFDGIVTAQPKVEALTASLPFAVDDRWLDMPVLDLYAGTTGIEGEAGQKGTPKPWALGQPRYVPGQLIDSVDTILQLSAYGEVQGIDVALERLNRFGASAGDHGSLATLKAATIPRGGWATCKALGLVRHGAPLDGLPSYILRGDAAGPDGWARKPGELIRRIADKLGKADRVSDTSLNALDVARPWNLSIYVGDQVTARDLIQRIAASVNAVAGVSWLGQLFVVPIDIGAPDLTLRSDGTAMPVVGDVQQIEVGQPYWRIALQAQRTWQVHDLADIAFSALLVDRGRYDAEATYREGDIVDMPDGSRWLHIATSPSVGVTPGSDPEVWFEMSAALSTHDILYPDGTPVADLQPAEPGATAGAPAGTFVADKLAEQIVAEAAELLELVQAERAAFSELLTSYLNRQLLEETRDARLNAISYLNGESLHTVQRRETQERIEGDTAIVTDMALLGAKSGDGTAWNLDLTTVRVSPTQALGEKFSELEASIATAEGQISANYSELQTAIADEEEARITAITTLTAAVDTLESDTAAAITSVQDAIADEASARATAISALEASVAGDIAAEVATLEDAIADEASARASALSTVNTTLGSHTSSISSLTSSLSSLTTTEANHYSTVTASIGTLNSTVTSHTGALATAEGRTQAYWNVVANAGSGAAAFVQLKAGAWGGSISSDVAIGAREIHISNSTGTGWTRTMDISAGRVRIWGDLQTTGSVTTPNLVSNSVTKVESTLSGSARTSTGDWYNVLSGAWHTFTLAYDADVIVLFMGRANYFGASSLIVRMILYDAAEAVIDSVEGPSAGSGDYMNNPCFPAKFSLSTGTYHVGPQFLADAGDVEMRSGSGVIVFIRYK